MLCYNNFRLAARGRAVSFIFYNNFLEVTVRAELGVKIIVWLWLKKGCRHLFYDPDGFLVKTPRVPWRQKLVYGLVDKR